MQERIRAKWLEGVLPFTVLITLRQGSLTEWEVLESLHRNFGLTPDAAKFRKIIGDLVSEGFLEDASEGGRRLLAVSKLGLRLLSEFEDSYEQIMFRINS
ncbi:MAG: hypothetical protein HYU39_08860 [Thaumarchaeota archaeon]|nr:hypothetical protein [Nitrososphaerota archaeon]